MWMCFVIVCNALCFPVLSVGRPCCETDLLIMTRNLLAVLCFAYLDVSS
jgi:hypothetical protein